MNIISDEACSAQESDSVTVSNPTNPTECITDSSSYEGRISEEMLCAGAPGKDSCQVPGLKLLHQIPTRPTRSTRSTRYQPDQSFQGDSGGPFTVKSEETNQHDLVGVVSWGDGCAAVNSALWAAYGHFQLSTSPKKRKRIINSSIHIFMTYTMNNQLINQAQIIK